MLQQTSKVEQAGHVVQSNRWRSKQSPCRINVTPRRLELSTLTIFHLPAQEIGYRDAPGAAEVKLFSLALIAADCHYRMISTASGIGIMSSSSPTKHLNIALSAVRASSWTICSHFAVLPLIILERSQSKYYMIWML